MRGKIRPWVRSLRFHHDKNPRWRFSRGGAFWMKWELISGSLDGVWVKKKRGGTLVFQSPRNVIARQLSVSDWFQSEVFPLETEDADWLTIIQPLNFNPPNPSLAQIVAFLKFVQLP